MNELTQDRARIFFLYPGAEVQVEDALHGTVTGTLYSVHFGPGNNYGINYVRHGMSVTRTALITNCKLLLTPVERVTDADFIEVFYLKEGRRSLRDFEVLEINRKPTCINMGYRFRPEIPEQAMMMVSFIVLVLFILKTYP